MNTRATAITALAGALLLAFAGAAAAAPQYNYSALSSLGGTNTGATAINNAGQISGTSDTSDGYSHAVVWSGTSVTDLGSAGRSSQAYAINSLGQVAGVAQDSSGNFLAAKWTGGQATLLPTLGVGIAQAQGINNAGTVVGYAVATNQVQQATIWSGGNAT